MKEENNKIYLEKELFLIKKKKSIMVKFMHQN